MVLYRQNVGKLNDKHSFRSLNQDQLFHFRLNHKFSFSSVNTFLETHFLQLHLSGGEGMSLKVRP